MARLFQPARAISRTRRWVANVALALLVVLPLWAFAIEPSRLVVRDVEVSLSVWPARLEDLKVALISDLHMGAPFVDEAKARKVVAATNDANVDLVLLLGDYVVGEEHNPDVFPEIPERVLLTVAGHTHGGQVVLPFLGRPVVPSRYGERYAIGEVVEGARHLYVTPGIGTSVFPVRFGVPPEISVLHLHAARPVPQ